MVFELTQRPSKAFDLTSLPELHINKDFDCPSALGAEVTGYRQD